MPTHPTTGVTDLLRLLASVLKARVQRSDMGEAIRAWHAQLKRRHRSADIVINLGLRRVLLVTSPELSQHVLAGPPSLRSYLPGTLKRKAMSFLAPNALTIASDDAWRTLRRFNEAVLASAAEPEREQAILTTVKSAFAEPVSDLGDIRQRMGTIMLATVFGEDGAPVRLAVDIQELFAEVGARTAILGSRKTAARDRFRDEIRKRWQDAEADKPSLLGAAKRAAANIEPTYRADETIADQIPHWMFTFIGSGSDLLARSLALILARQDVLERLRSEITGNGRAETPGDVRALREMEACILEAGRLFPPAPQTAHRAAIDDQACGTLVPAGTELLQVFALSTRDVARDPTADSFRPERWLAQPDEATSLYPNLFLSGPRACPGRDLILFIIKAAIACQLQNPAITARQSSLTTDPVPLSFPRDSLRY